MNRILSKPEWVALARAEKLFYEDDPGCHGYTDVNRRVEATLAAQLWDHAEAHVDNQDYESNPDTSAQGPVFDETAERVAYALAVLAFGRDLEDA